MSGLKMKSEPTTIHSVYYSDMDDFVSFHYGVVFSTANDTEFGNFTPAIFQRITKTVPLNFDSERFETMRVTGQFPVNSLRTILLDLCARGFIPEGTYFVGVW